MGSGWANRLVIVGIGVALIAGGAYAAVSHKGGKITACYAKRGGDVRIVKRASECTADEKRIRWNKQGPVVAGAPGAPGTVGPQGPTGPSGSVGPTGPKGPAGLDGSTGATGAIGPTGVTGAIGLTGPTGPAGSTGRQVVTDSVSGSGNGLKSNSINCPADTVAVGGGGGAFGVVSDANGLGPRMTASIPITDPNDSSLTGWRVDAYAQTAFGGSWNLNVYAVCVNAP